MKRATTAAILAALTAIPAAQAQDERSPEAIYEQLCATCHGPEMQGGNAQSMVDGVWLSGGSAGNLARSIERGITPLGMPAYEDVLSDNEIRGLAQYILTKEEEVGAVKPPPPTSIQTLDYEIDVAIWQEDLENPWGIDFIDADTALLTEKAGKLWMIRGGERASAPVSGLPEVLNEGQGGLMDVAVDPDYADNGWVYISYAHGIEDPSQRRAPAMTRIARGKIQDNSWTDSAVIFTAPEETYSSSRVHFGSRITFDNDGALYFSVGERGAADNAQDLSLPNGKIHRINRDGSIPEDNPFVDTPDAMKSIYSYGHRNPQGLATSPLTGDIWDTEHGPLGGDEANFIQKGANYGWPVATWGRDYSGRPVSDDGRAEGMTQPALYWRPSTAVCGLDFYQGEQFPMWNNRLLVGALKYEQVSLLNIEGDRVMHQEVILRNAGRVRDVECGADGAIYVILNAPDMVLKLTKNKERSYE